MHICPCTYICANICIHTGACMHTQMCTMRVNTHVRTPLALHWNSCAGPTTSVRSIPGMVIPGDRWMSSPVPCPCGPGQHLTAHSSHPTAPPRELPLEPPNFLFYFLVKKKKKRRKPQLHWGGRGGSQRVPGDSPQGNPEPPKQEGGAPGAGQLSWGRASG